MKEIIVERLSPTIDADSLIIPINTTGHILIPEFYKYLGKTIRDHLLKALETFGGELPEGYVLEARNVKGFKSRTIYYVSISKEVNPTEYNSDDVRLYYRAAIRKARGDGMHSLALSPPYSNNKKILEEIIKVLIKEIRPYIDFFDKVYFLYYSALIRDLITTNLDLLNPM
ncbi:MAG: hypothetical protein ACTSXX_09085 [Candidatus Baldrarchaeia archaeon]